MNARRWQGIPVAPENPRAPVAGSGPRGDVRFLCDTMLGRLARWLRAAGYDTTLANGTESDRALLHTAICETRMVLTLDRGFLEHKAAPGHVVLLGSEAVSDQAHQLMDWPGVDWLFKPFTRCAVDNTPLRPATAADEAALPPRVRLRGGAVTVCPNCGRTYWAGDHHRHMRKRLEDWTQLQSGAQRETLGSGQNTAE